MKKSNAVRFYEALDNIARVQVKEPGIYAYMVLEQVEEDNIRSLIESLRRS